ncbi:MAG: hypothetical protein WCT41_02310 [Candidatus Paceibacterota bacterium]|jgi:hypothetical protein
MTSLTQEIVVVINSPIENQEHIAFRVSVRPQQLVDSSAKSSYAYEIFKAFMIEACKKHELDFDACTANVIFPDADSIREAAQSDLPSDLLRVRPGMFTADLADGVFLLH